MKFPNHKHANGIALIIVMIVIVVFSLLAGGFAYTMKVETKLARNATWDTELEWLGRSGIELAKYVLAQPGAGGQQYDALNQKWAGGTGETNDPIAWVDLNHNELGSGTFSVKITDLDRKFNINSAPEEILRQALILIGSDAADSPTIVNAIMDWRDTDDHTHVGSSDTESDYYLTLRPPYRAKNGPIDDITELLLVRGITPGMFWGSGGSAGANRKPSFPVPDGFRAGEEPLYAAGFADLFTTISAGFVNINTASATILQLIPDIDENLAQAIISTRSGIDGAEGTPDDMPFRNPAELSNVPGMNAAISSYLRRFFSVRSSTFEVQVTAQVDQVKRTYIALVRRNGRDIQTLYMHWK